MILLKKNEMKKVVELMKETFGKKFKWSGKLTNRMYVNV